MSRACDDGITTSVGHHASRLMVPQAASCLTPPCTCQHKGHLWVPVARLTAQHYIEWKLGPRTSPETPSRIILGCRQIGETVSLVLFHVGCERVGLFVSKVRSCFKPFEVKPNITVVSPLVAASTPTVRCQGISLKLLGELDDVPFKQNSKPSVQ